MTRLLVIRSIKILTPLLTFKDVFGEKKVIMVLPQGPPGKRRNQELSEVAVRVTELQKQQKPRVILLASIPDKTGLALNSAPATVLCSETALSESVFCASGFLIQIVNSGNGIKFVQHSCFFLISVWGLN